MLLTQNYTLYYLFKETWVKLTKRPHNLKKKCGLAWASLKKRGLSLRKGHTILNMRELNLHVGHTKIYLYIYLYCLFKEARV